MSMPVGRLILLLREQPYRADAIVDEGALCVYQDGEELARIALPDEPMSDYQDEPEPPLTSAGERWAEEHLGEIRRRPAGEVLYRVLGSAGGYGGVVVRRTSDGREATMGVLDIEHMVTVDPADLDDWQRARLGPW